MGLKIDPVAQELEPVMCQIYVRAEDSEGVERTVTLDMLTRESLLDYVREHGAEKVLLHLLGHY